MHVPAGPAHNLSMTTQSPEQAAPKLGKTANGIEITDGLIVITNEMRAGKVLASTATIDGWFDVEYASGGRVMQNAERVATFFAGRSARQMWANDMADRVEAGL